MRTEVHLESGSIALESDNNLRSRRSSVLSIATLVRRWLLVVLACAAIFLLSRDSASVQHSTRILRWILTLFQADTPARVAHLAGPFRKLAHITVYAVLAFTTFRAFALGQSQISSWRIVWRALAFCCFYAATDEFHQRFIPNRVPSVWDVGIDTCGAFVMLLLIHFAVSRRSDSTPPASDSLTLRSALAPSIE